MLQLYNVEAYKYIFKHKKSARLDPCNIGGNKQHRTIKHLNENRVECE